MAIPALLLNPQTIIAIASIIPKTLDLARKMRQNKADAERDDWSDAERAVLMESIERETGERHDIDDVWESLAPDGLGD